jgi:hypothetical protein
MAAGIHQLPSRPLGFVNRVEELDLLDRLTSPSGREAPPIVVVGGAYGVGKSALVQQWAHLNRGRFPDGIFYADFAWGDVDAQALLDTIMRELGISEDRMPADLEERTELYVARSSGKRLLVLLEDVQRQDQVEPLIPTHAPQSAVIVTTRAPGDDTLLPGANRIVVPPLSRAAAADLLESVTGRFRLDEEVRMVNALIGRAAGLPLAVRIAAQRLRVDPGLRLGALVGEMESSSDDPAAAHAKGEPDLLINAVYRTLPDETALLYRRLAAHPGPSFTPVIASVAAGDPELPVGGALDGFRELQLAERRGQRLRFHEPLLRHAAAALRADEPNEERQAAARIADFYASAAVLLGLTIVSDRPSRLNVGDPESRWSESEAQAWFDVEWPNLLAVMGDATERDWRGRAQVIGEAVIGEVVKREASAAVNLRNALVHGSMRLGRDLIEELGFAEELPRGLSEESVAAFLAEAETPVVLEPGLLRLEWPAEAEAFKLERYLASGGESALLRLGDESILRVEAHPESFALVWPSECSLDSLLERVVGESDIAPGADTMALIVTGDGAVDEVGLDEMLTRSSGPEAGDIEFVRLDLTDWVVTWRRTADPALHARVEPMQELGLGADSLDRERIQHLLEQTGVESISSEAERLVVAAEGVLNLAPGGEGSDG